MIVRYEVALLHPAKCAVILCCLPMTLVSLTSWKSFAQTPQTAPKIGDLYDQLIERSQTNAAAAEIVGIVKNDPACPSPKVKTPHRSSHFEFSEGSWYNFYRVVKLLFKGVGPRPRRSQEHRQKSPSARRANYPAVGCLCRAVVAMMQAAQSCASNDLANRHRAQALTWSFFAEPEVSSVVMVVANVVGEKSLQVKLIESDDMI